MDILAGSYWLTQSIHTLMTVLELVGRNSEFDEQNGDGDGDGADRGE